ncbi:hypothetical protein LLG96_18410 [bacterium]|nr:hypothetical protein [bacterium]
MKTLINHMVIVSVIFFIIVISGGCGMTEVESTWRDRPVTVDGVDGGAEWDNARYSFEEGKVSVGLLNDENTLYIRLATRDIRLQRQLMAAGFTVWFDENGGKKKLFGIHFPLGMRGGGRPMMRNRDQAERPDDSVQPEVFQESMQKEMELLGPEKDTHTDISVVDAQKYGISCQIGSVKGNLVYELCIPLLRSESQPYSVGTKGSKVIGIGLATGKINFNQMRNRGEGRSGGQGSTGGVGRRGGGGGGMGGPGGRGGGRGGMGGPGETSKTESLELWLKTTLALSVVSS